MTRINIAMDAVAPSKASLDAAKLVLATDAAIQARDKARTVQSSRFKARHGVDLPACFHTRATTGKTDWAKWCESRREALRTEKVNDGD